MFLLPYRRQELSIPDGIHSFVTLSACRVASSGIASSGSSDMAFLERLGSVESVAYAGEDSHASMASLSDLASDTQAPTDFGFLKRAFKKRRLASPMNRSRTAQAQTTPGSPSSPESQLPAAGSHLEVAGPEMVQTLRGQLFGREAALVLCGEAHEDAIDLTRKDAVPNATLGWSSLPPTCAPDEDVEPIARKRGLALDDAKDWAETVLEKVESQKELDTAGALLVFSSSGRTKGVAMLYPPGAKRKQDSLNWRGRAVFEWVDTDEGAREFNRRRRVNKTEPMSVEEQDAIIARRKGARLEEGIELFDDWLIRQFSSQDIHVDFVMEAPVAAAEVELHVESGVGPAPLAHERLRRLELDTEEDADQKTLPGNGSFLDYLRRQVVATLPLERVHFVDPRALGDAEDDSLPEAFRGSFQAWVDPDAWNREVDEAEVPPVPSWEAFLGGAADLLYYAPHAKADFTAFLTGCVGSARALSRFHEALYFKTIPEALKEIKINETTRPMACVRSVAYQPPDPQNSLARRPKPKDTLLRRPIPHCNSGRRLLPVRSAPVDRYLKARGFPGAPRTWVAGMAEQLRLAGATDLLKAAEAFYRDSVSVMLADPKGNDVEGDNFVAWLRACHKDIYFDIDTSDPSKLRERQWAQSKNGKRRYNLKDIRIPGVDAAFEELLRADPRISTDREQVLSKIIIDAYQLRLVDLSMLLKMANLILSAPEEGRIVIVVYAGLDHTRNVAKFWESQGFNGAGLPKKGVIGEDHYEDDEPRHVWFPPYLHDFKKLFPVPAAMGDAAKALQRSG